MSCTTFANAFLQSALAILSIATLAAVSTAHADSAKGISTSLESAQTLDAPLDVVVADAQIEGRSLALAEPRRALRGGPSSSGSGGGSPATATFYSNIYGGACGYGRDIPQYIAAVSQSLWSGGGGACGLCYQLTCSGSDYGSNACTGQSVVIRVTDLCPNRGNDICARGPHFDLNAAAFRRLGNQALGVLRIKYRRVQCQLESGTQGAGAGLKLRILASTRWYIQASFAGLSDRVTAVEVSVRSGTWKRMKPGWGATWSVGDFAGEGRVAFKLKSAGGRTLAVSVPSRGVQTTSFPGRNF